MQSKQARLVVKPAPPAKPTDTIRSDDRQIVRIEGHAGQNLPS
jgi:hypothetical protein